MLGSQLRKEWPLAVVWSSALLWLFYGTTWSSSLQTGTNSALALLWVCAAILFSAFAVVRHADVLAARLGEPFGTMILTFAVISLEVLLIGSVMLQGNEPTLARDTMYSVLMIVLTGFVGLCLLLGGIKFREQSFNLQGANAYLAMILPLAVVGLVLPLYTRSGSPGFFSPQHEVALVVLSLAIYGVFLLLQTSRHRSFFRQSGEEHGSLEEHASSLPSWAHLLMLFAYILPVIALAKTLAPILHQFTQQLGLPSSVAGLIVALLLLCPEGLAAIESALNNRIQRSVNILLGSVLATIGLTIPAALGIGLLTGKPVLLGLDSPEMVLMLVTQALCMLTFAQGRTNMLQGAIHLLMFGVYLFVVLDSS
ncbi:MAG: ionic transporter y4hA [Chthoniobacterales bacterium]|jgi:Ca2+:H+ antiporter